MTHDIMLHAYIMLHVHDIKRSDLAVGGLFEMEIWKATTFGTDFLSLFLPQFATRSRILAWGWSVGSLWIDRSQLGARCLCQPPANTTDRCKNDIAAITKSKSDSDRHMSITSLLSRGGQGRGLSFFYIIYSQTCFMICKSIFVSAVTLMLVIFPLGSKVTFTPLAEWRI